MITIINICISLIVMALVYCAFAIVDAWEEYDFYEHYAKWHDQYMSDIGVQPVDDLGYPLDVDQVRSL